MIYSKTKRTRFRKRGIYLIRCESIDEMWKANESRYYPGISICPQPLIVRKPLLTLSLGAHKHIYGEAIIICLMARWQSASLTLSSSQTLTHNVVLRRCNTHSPAL